MIQFPEVNIKTNQGEIVIKLNAERAPETVANFLAYVNDKHYENTIFHRVINGFMIQGGGYDQDMQEKDVKDPIKNEADNGLKNKRGTIAMARTNDPHSATSQFFINLVDNDFLDFRAAAGSGWGYCVFGEVSGGIEVVDKIKECKTGKRGFHQDVPVDPIVIESITIINQ